MTSERRDDLGEHQPMATTSLGLSTWAPPFFSSSTASFLLTPAGAVSSKFDRGEIDCEIDFLRSTYDRRANAQGGAELRNRPRGQRFRKSPRESLLCIMSQDGLGSGVTEEELAKLEEHLRKKYTRGSSSVAAGPSNVHPERNGAELHGCSDHSGAEFAARSEGAHGEPNPIRPCSVCEGEGKVLNPPVVWCQGRRSRFELNSASLRGSCARTFL